MTIETFLAKQAAHTAFLASLPAGFHNDPSDHNAAINIVEHHGLLIVHQWDKRGPNSDFWYDIVTVELDGTPCSFNTLDDAYTWINNELGL